MNATVGIQGLTALRRIDAADAVMGAALCTLLRDAGMVAGLTEPQGIMFSTEGAASFAVVSVAGRAPVCSPDRVSEAVALLDAIDPMLLDIETTLGISLDATGMGDAVPGSIGIRLARDDISLILAIARDHYRRVDWIASAAALTPSAPHMPVAVSLTMSGPRLTVADASALAVDDLLLIPQIAAASLHAAHMSAITGAFDLSTGRFSCGQTGDPMSDDSPPNDFMVPLTIKLPDRMTSASSLSSLVPGSTLPLGPLTEGMPVELRVADRLLARGELVQLGDRFAVLIEDRADIHDAPSAGGD